MCHLVCIVLTERIHVHASTRQSICFAKWPARQPTGGCVGFGPLLAVTGWKLISLRASPAWTVEAREQQSVRCFRAWPPCHQKRRSTTLASFTRSSARTRY